jgi:hypothetical protein
MEPQFQTSFIPKKSIAQSSRGFSFGGFNILMFVAVFLFTVSLVGSVGVFFYKLSKVAQIDILKVEIDKAQSWFDQASIRDMRRYMNQVKSARAILAGHIAPSQIFETLSAKTSVDVRYTNFSYSIGGEGSAGANSGSNSGANAKSAGPTLTMSGEAKNFNAVAFQSGVFGESGFVENPVFTGVDLDTKNNAVFKLEAGLNTEKLSFKNRISGQGNGASQ